MYCYWWWALAVYALYPSILINTPCELGCDKTVPAQLMGGISAKKPVLPLITGPMMPGSFRGGRIGACTDCRHNWAAFRANEIDIEDISALNEELAPTVSEIHTLLV